jgi:sortase (surface protein transpeptidase)
MSIYIVFLTKKKGIYYVNKSQKDVKKISISLVAKNKRKKIVWMITCIFFHRDKKLNR